MTSTPSSENCPIDLSARTERLAAVTDYPTTQDGPAPEAAELVLDPVPAQEQDTDRESARAREALERVRLEVGKAVVGQDAAVAGLVIALLCRGHVLIEGVPGVAKTLLVRALSAALR